MEPEVTQFLESIPEWKNEKIMDNMFCGLPKKTVDEGSYESKYAFWSDLILRMQNHLHSATFSMMNLQGRFRKNGVAPHCLHAIVEIMLENNMLLNIRLVSSVNERRYQGWISWMANCILFRNQKRLIDTDDLIISEHLHFQSESLWKIVDSQAIYPSDRLVLVNQMDGFYEKLKTETNMQAIRLQYLIQYLIFVRIVAPIKSTCQNSIVEVGYKFIPYSSTHNWSPPENAYLLQKLLTNNYKRLEQTKTDFHILSLRKTIFVMFQRTQLFLEKADESKQKALELLRQNQKKLALVYVKRKNHYHEQHIQHLATVHNLETVYQSIQAAETDVQLFEAYKSANFSLKSITKELDIDQLDSIVVELQEAIEVQNQFDQNLNFSVETDDEEELEKELQSLIDDTHPLELHSSLTIESLKQSFDSLALSKRPQRVFSNNLDLQLPRKPHEEHVLPSVPSSSDNPSALPLDEPIHNDLLAELSKIEVPSADPATIHEENASKSEQNNNKNEQRAEVVEPIAS